MEEVHQKEESLMKQEDKKGSTSACQDGMNNKSEGHPRTINLDSAKDRRDLSEWCEFHFNNTVEKGIRGFNAPIWHDCCLGLSKRGFTKKDTHCPETSCSVLKISAFKLMTSTADFEAWILDRIRARAKHAGLVPFPSVNTSHWEQPGVCELPPFYYIDYADKTKHRYFALLEKERQYETHLKTLIRDNLRLHASCKHWHSKYEALLSEDNESDAEFYETPMKKLTKLSSDDLLSL